MQQAEFLGEASNFRSKEYKWPDDPLHCWSRIWEYPYVYYHFSKLLNDFVGVSQPLIADVGSGVTFFPFSLARLGCEIICTDIDPVCEKDILRAKGFVSSSPGNVKFRLIINESLPFADNECDALYCISVLEHIPNFENTVREMARVLKPGGVCLITCDLGLDPQANLQLNARDYIRLISAVTQQFDLIYPERTVHPVDVLTSRNSPYSGNNRSCFLLGWQLMKQKIIKPLLGRKPGCVNLFGPMPLAIYGLILQKR